MAGLLDRISAGLRAFNRVRTFDNVLNIEARLGVGQGAGNQSASTTYGISVVSWNRQQLDNAYRGSWLVGIGVDAKADDMTKKGISLVGDYDPDEREAIHSAYTELALWDQIGDAVRWARLYGGAICVLLVDGQDMATPLRVESIRRDQFKGLLVLDRWMVNPLINEPVLDFGPDYGMPEFYQVNVGTSGIAQPAAGSLGQRIHYSRCIRFDGARLPFFARQQQNSWGQSVVERLWDRLVAFDSATQGASQLVFKAHLRTLSIEGLRETMAIGGDAVRGMIATIEFMRRFQSNEGISLIDKADAFETHQYNFAGLPELLAQLAEQIAGALQIPMVRLFGQSPAGFSTGETDLANYHESVGTEQNRNLRRPVIKLNEVLCRSLLGHEPPENANFTFNPLTEMTATEKADVATKVTAAVGEAHDKQIIGRKTALEELRENSQVTGVFGHISDEEIDDAENDPPKPNENVGLTAITPPSPNQPGALPNGPGPRPVQRPNVAIRA
jgi:phage-related protein (TIGR01555 family)